MRIKKFIIETSEEEINVWLRHVKVIDIRVGQKYIVIVYEPTYKPKNETYIKDEVNK